MLANTIKNIGMDTNFILIGQLFQVIKHSKCLKHKNNKTLYTAM